MTQIYRVAKTGAHMFDAQHAYGLGIALACSSRTEVQLRDEGTHYYVSFNSKMDDHIDVLAEALSLPSKSDLQRAKKSRTGLSDVRMANLDGLLAAHFTIPGIRLVSVADLLYKQTIEANVIGEGLRKIETVVTRWRKHLKKATRGSMSWLAEALKDYDAMKPHLAVPATQSSDHHVTILMTIDPAFSYSTRRPQSDGLITDKTNVVIPCMPYAGLFAFIGAARFLRAQRVSNNLVNFYLPLAESMTLEAPTALPRLFAFPEESERALVLEWLGLQNHNPLPKARWKGLAYQVLQTQGAHQSISRTRGCLDYTWLTELAQSAGPQIIGYWQKLLGTPRDQAPFETENLVDALLYGALSAWNLHLADMAFYQHHAKRPDARTYTLREIREVTRKMESSKSSSLKVVLERSQGTVRFGHALRLLGREKPNVLRDLIDGLDVIQTRDQLMRLLARAAQECSAAGAKTDFMVYPNDDDLAILLDDVERFSAKEIAGLLILLSAIRYPRAQLASPDTTPPLESLFETRENVQ
jgi:hypothetical protein